MTHHTITDEKRAALDAVNWIVDALASSDGKRESILNSRYLGDVLVFARQQALTTPTDNVVDEVVEALEDILTVIKEGHMQTFKITNSATGETWNWHDEWAKMATEALIKKNGGG